MAWRGVGAALAAVLVVAAALGPAAQVGSAKLDVLIQPQSVSEDRDTEFKLIIENVGSVDVRIVHARIKFPWEPAQNTDNDGVNITLKPNDRDAGSVRWSTYVPAGSGGKTFTFNITLVVQEAVAPPGTGWKSPLEDKHDVTVAVNTPCSLDNICGQGLLAVGIAVVVIIALSIVAVRVKKKKRAEALARKKAMEAMREQQERAGMYFDESQVRPGPPGGMAPGPPMGGPPPGAGPAGPPVMPPSQYQPGPSGYGPGPPMGPPPVYPGGPGPAGPPPGGPPVQPPPQPVPVAPSPAEVSCGACGTKSDARANSCWKCGAALKK